MYDAILVPGGGLADDGSPAPWVCSRLDEAAAAAGNAWLILLSAGTTHKPPQLNHHGFPIFESTAGAEYLVQRGYPATKILLDTWSLDTIGNAYFARYMHCEPRGFTRLLVVTSHFHLTRTRVIFDWIYSLSPASCRYEIDYLGTPNTGLDDATLVARTQKEAASMAQLEIQRTRIRTAAEFHAFLFSEHAAYACLRRSANQPEAAEQWKNSY